MSVTFREVTGSRAFDLNSRDGSAPFKWFATVVGEANPENAIYAALLADTTTAPFFWNGLLRGRPKARDLGGGIYDVELPYTLPPGGIASDPGAVGTPPNMPPPAPPQPAPTPTDAVALEINGEFGGKPPRLMRGLKTFSKTGALNIDTGGAALVNIVPPDYGHSINVGKDGKVEGVELPDPAFAFTVKKVVPQLTYGFLSLRLRKVLWRANDKPFLTFPSGEVVYMGLSFTTREDGFVEMVHKFGADFDDKGPDGAGIRVGAGLLVPLRPAWHVLWVAFGPAKSAGRMVDVPYSAYVEQVLDFADFGVLGI